MKNLLSWIFKNKFSAQKKLVAERLEGMSHIQEFSDGSVLIMTNKEFGSVNGKHYTSYVDQVKQLKRERKHKEAIDLLLQLVKATETEANCAGENWGVAPWYYEQLAIIYRKDKMYADEVAILERYAKQTKAPGVKPQKLAERLIKARALLAKGQNNR